MAAPYPTCYLDGRFQPLADARVSPLDRGYLFADGVYEVIPVHRGRPFRMREHLDRLARSLDEVRIANPTTTPAGPRSSRGSSPRPPPPSSWSTCR